MKKSLVSALTTALVVGAASTTFAAANPFSDVPADHWAYDAVTQLAADGVVEGYGDGTYRGDRNITRYEMAQMIAKAMAKQDVSASTKALLDKLAAEFREELNNLGVRVSNLEKHADMVKWTGELRYRYWNRRDKQEDGSKDKLRTNQLQLRLFPTAEVNEHWNVKARLTATNNMKTDTAGDVALTYAFAEGDYNNFNVKLGKMPFYDTSTDGLIVDDFFSGAQLTFGKDFKGRLEAGRFNLDRANSALAEANGDDTAANYFGVELMYDKDKLKAGAAYRHFSNDAFRTVDGYNKPGKSTNKAQIWSVGAKYAFNRSIALGAYYANNTKANKYDKAYNIQLDYKGIKPSDKGSWGAHAAYRYLGHNVAFAPTYDTALMADLDTNVKGWDFGIDYIPLKNVRTSVAYFTGKQLENKKRADVFFGRVSFFF
ncbi:MAG: S-layer homology domain-containing protein [Selenomonadaceae bacterium]|nr:S-layer homology domain-containing protein [Selenomonadaceae bacterium]